ncbi:hypothetical protein [Novosphingobium rosa]|uniref:hypothetical protein n=1 Tax=Novosphingobium rosa TaxID=76978 RepID=UPI00082EAE32|nr:hypothetical protein [Novosphingobium rosa]
MIFNGPQRAEGEALSKFIAPAPLKRKSAMRIATLEALVTAMEDALDASGTLLIKASVYGELSDEAKESIRAQIAENSELQGIAQYHLEEGRAQ